MTFEFIAANGLNEHGVNAEISATLLDDKKMRKAGFADNKEKWFLFKHVGNPKYDISFSVEIPKQDPGKLRIDVLDEDFCQPYDYQHILINNPICIPALRVWIDVEELMEQLKDAGIINGHVFGEYI